MCPTHAKSGPRVFISLCGALLGDGEQSAEGRDSHSHQGTSLTPPSPTAEARDLKTLQREGTGRALFSSLPGSATMRAWGAPHSICRIHLWSHLGNMVE